MASFMLQESRDYCIELGSPLRACYLDAKAAFDKVWLTGLVYKLHTMGVRGKLLRIVNSILRGTRSQVLHDGRLSKPFHIEQGTHQGSICAPFYYTVYINDLLKDLSASTYGLHIGEVPLSAPTQAQSNICDMCLKTYYDKVYHVLFQCECNTRVSIIQVFYDMTTYKFGKSTRKLLVESNIETFIGYVLGATDNLLKCAIPVELYPDFLISCSHVLRYLSEKQ